MDVLFGLCTHAGEYHDKQVASLSFLGDTKQDIGILADMVVCAARRGPHSVHPLGKLTRTAAIQTVKRWVPDTQPLSQLVIDFALSLYARLEQLPEPEIEAKKEDEEGTSNGAGVGDGEGAEGDEMDMDETPPPEPVKIPFAVVKDGRVVDRLDPPKILHDVLQHVELLLALCVKQPDLLDP